MHYDESDAACGRVHERLARCESLEAVSDRRDELQLFADFDLASLVENRLGQVLDPASLDSEARRRWIHLVTHDPRDVVWNPSRCVRCYWLRDGAARVGTIGVWTTAVGSQTVRVDSLFVPPAHRRRGIARRALLAAYECATSEGFAGIRLDTEWCWQPTVRFYCAQGMWVHGWKRDLHLVWRNDLPAWRVDRESDAARFVVAGGRVLVEARRSGERLEWREAAASVDDRDGAALYAPGTFALALALEGWPLITSDEAWQKQLRQGFSDFGGPEGLAFKIRHWEEWARDHAWRVDTPRIPGLACGPRRE